MTLSTVYRRACALTVTFLFLFTGWASAQSGIVPPIPLQDTSPIECDPVLDQPVSGKNVSGASSGIPPQYGDLDLDGFPNLLELQERSDPTWERSTPNDRDGDGVPRESDIPSLGGCDFDGRIPNLFSLRLACNPACDPATSIARNQILIFEVEIKQQVNPDTFVDPDGNLVECDVSYDVDTGSGLDLEFNRTVTLLRNSQGHYSRNVPVLNRDFAGDWHIDCEALFAGAAKSSNAVQIAVRPVAFAVTIDLDAVAYFEDESISIVAEPSSVAHAPEDGEARLLVTTEEGVPLHEDPDGDLMDWDEELEAWTASIPVDRLEDVANLIADEPNALLDWIEGKVFDGNWQIQVNAHDAAPGSPNTGEATKAVPVSSILVDSLRLTSDVARLIPSLGNLPEGGPSLSIVDYNQVLPNGLIEDAPVERKDSIVYTVDYKFKNVPTNGATIRLRVVNETNAIIVNDVLMTAAAGVNGRYNLTFPIPIGLRSGDLKATATLTRTAPTGTLNVPSNDVITSVTPTDVELIVQTDKPSYSKGQTVPTADAGLDEGSLPSANPGLVTPAPTASPTVEPGPTPSADPGLTTPAPTASPTVDEGTLPTVNPTVTTDPAPSADPGLDPGTTPSADPGVDAGPTPGANPVVTTGSPTASPGVEPGPTPSASPTATTGTPPTVNPDVSSEGEAEEIVIEALVQGTEGADFFDDVAGDPDEPPGTATYTLYFVDTVQRPGLPPNVQEPDATQGKDEIGVPVASGPMTWVCEADLTDCRFQAAYQLEATDPPGSWRAVVDYKDDATGRRNFGASGRDFIVFDVQTAGTPEVDITQVNGEAAPAPPLDVDLDVEAWTIQGTYKFTNSSIGPAEADPADANQVWVRINSGASALWREATLISDPDDDPTTHAGTWSITLRSQRDYGIARDGVFDVQAVAINSPFETATACDADSSTTEGPTERALCDAYGPNGPVGQQLLSAPVNLVYSRTDVVKVNLAFADVAPQALLQGAKSPTGALLGNGDVLWNGTTHTIQGRIVSNGNSLTSARLHIQRVAFDNCAANLNPTAGVSLLSVLDDAEEWCRRDIVTRYEGPTTSDADDIFGYELTDPPADLAARLSSQDSDGVLRFNLTWDIRDSKQGPAGESCPANGEGEGSYLVESNETLVRRTNGVFNSSKAAKFPGAGGLNACPKIPERLEDQTFLKAWEKTVANQSRAADKPPMIEPARYWVWFTMTTDKGFTFDQVPPTTRDDIKAAGGDLTAQANSKTPTPASIDGAAVAGDIPNSDAVQLRFQSATPWGTVTQMTSLTGQGDVVSGELGQPLFHLRSLNAPVTFYGNISNNGNPVVPGELRLFLYRLVFENCLSDSADDQDVYSADADGEWCVQADTSIPITTFPDGAYDPAATAAGEQAFEVVWTPSVSAVSSTDNWWATVSIKTEDGDRYERAPPAMDRRQPEGGLFPVAGQSDTNFNLATYNYLRDLEIMCAGVLCNPVGVAPESPPPAYLSGQPGVFPFDYTAVSLIVEKPNVEVSSLGLLKPSRAASPFGSYGADCAWTSVGTPLPNQCAASTRNGRTLAGAIAADSITLEGDGDDFGFLNDLSTVRVQFQALAYNASTSTAAPANEITLATPLDVLIGLSVESTSPTVTVERTLSAVADNDYLENAHWSLVIDTTSFPETIGPNAEAMRKITASYGAQNTRTNIMGKFILTLTSESSVTRTVTAFVEVDRVTAPQTSLASVQRTTTDDEFELVSETIPEDELEKEIEGGLPVYTLDGNVVFNFTAAYEEGVDLGNPNINAQRLASVDVATEIQSPPLEWHIGGAQDDSPLAELLPESIVLDEDTPVVGPLIFPLVICPQTNQEACNFNGNNNQGAQVDRVTVFFLPVRAGLDPPFVRVEATDPWDPATWVMDLDLNDDTYNADLFVSGTVVDQEGDGFMMDNPPTGGFGGDNRTVLHFFYVGVQGGLGPDNLEASVSTIVKQQANSASSAGNPTTTWQSAGVDPNCGDYLASSVPPDGQADPNGIGNCVHPVTPLSPGPLTDEEYLAGCIAGIQNNPNHQRLSDCFVAHDDWGGCFLEDHTNRQPADPEHLECAKGTSNGDETQQEAWVLINANLPIWIQSPNKSPVGPCTNDPVGPNPPPTGCYGGPNWQGPTDPDAPEPSDGNFTIPRGFIWSHHNATADSNITVVGPDGLNIEVHDFEDVFVTLDPEDADYGKLRIRDGRYLITVRAVDNTESLTSKEPLAFGEVANDAARYQEFVMVLENDADGDGVSDLREAWLNEKIRTNTMCQELNACNLIDRYRDPATSFPDPQDGDSDEQDWDGDGIPNRLPVAVGTLQPAGDAFVDVELLLNADPLLADLPGEAGVCDPTTLTGSPGAGPLGDRNRNCVANVLDEDKSIRRCLDSDGDGYCNTEELAANSDPNDPDSTPADRDGNGIPDSVDELFGTIPLPVCTATVNGPCDHGHLAAVTLNQAVGATTIGHVYLDQAGSGTQATFSVGYNYTGEEPAGCNAIDQAAASGHCELVGTSTLTNALDIVVGLVNGRVCLAGAPDPINDACDHGHLLQVTLNQAVGATTIGHVYVDQAGSGETTTFSVGFNYTGEAPAVCNPIGQTPATGHCEIIGSETLAGAQAIVLGLVNGEICLSSASPPLNNTCDHGHFATAKIGQTISGTTYGHVYVDKTGTGNNEVYAVGFNYTGTKPTGCNEVSAGHCEVARTKSVNEVTGLLMDPDGDGATTQQELNMGTSPSGAAGCATTANSNPCSNPFYKYSRPDDPTTTRDENGVGFPLDYDGDGTSSHNELTGASGGQSNPLQRCSNRNTSDAWSPTNPTATCDDEQYFNNET